MILLNDDVIKDEEGNESLDAYDIDKGLEEAGIYQNAKPEENNIFPLGIGEQVDEQEIKEWEN